MSTVKGEPFPISMQVHNMHAEWNAPVSGKNSGTHRLKRKEREEEEEEVREEEKEEGKKRKR